MKQNMTQAAQSEAMAAFKAFEQRFGVVVHAQKRKFILLIVLLCAAAIGAGYFWLTQRSGTVQYVIAHADKGSVVRVVSGTGTVNPILTIIVGSYVSGVIQSISCDFNTQVHKGQLCAKIDPRPYQSIVNQNAADLATAKAQLIKDQANLVYAQLNFKRNQDLLAAKAVSQDAADVARNAYNQAQAQVTFDQATIQERQAELDSANVNLGYTNITSPVDGTVVSRNVTIGQTVAASFQTPTLFLIATDLTQMEVDTNVSESDIGSLKAGDKATFTVEAYPDKIFQGVVAQVRQAPQSVQNVITYDIVINVDNKDLLLKPGMTATTRIVIAERDHVVRVPDQALRFSPDQATNTQRQPGGESHIWILQKGQPAALPVTLGLDDDSYSEVTSGNVQPGTTLIVGRQPGMSTSSGSPTPRLF